MIFTPTSSVFAASVTSTVTYELAATEIFSGDEVVKFVPIGSSPKYTTPPFNLIEIFSVVPDGGTPAQMAHFVMVVASVK